MTNFKYVGKWDRYHDVDMYEIDGEVFALHGWNGEKYLSSWKCTGEDHMGASKEEYVITPIYSDELNDDDYEIIDYDVKRA